ncbi:response regulator [Calothrix sp. NIES-2098]|uniref:response regulator n=1 Tax=Calothrix sp. NIES-2098 TaxID=1954171 RepID=UPI0030D83351
MKRKPQRTLLSIDGLRLLVVDDNDDARSLVTFILKEYQVQVQTARTVDEAIEIIQDWKPDVLISDISMPGKDGYSLINWIRNQEAKQGGFLPAIALTGYVYPEYRIKAIDAGFEEVISKPFHPDGLIATIAKLVQKSNAQRIVKQEQSKFVEQSLLLRIESQQLAEQVQQARKKTQYLQEQAQQAMEEARQIVEKVQLASQKTQQLWHQVQSSY